MNRHRRGISGGGVAAMIAAGVVLVVVGYLLGARQRSVPLEASEAVMSPDVAMPVTDPASAGRSASAQRPPESEPARADAPAVRPTFHFEPPSLDFGRIAIGESAEGSFDIVNTGSTPLTILAMRPSCTCTTLEDLSGVEIEPGARRRVDARLDSRSYPSTARSQIRFLFEGLDPVDFEMRASVTHPVEATPVFIQAQESFQGEVSIASTDGEAFRILAADGLPPQYTCGFDPRVDAPRSSYRLTWDFSDYDPQSCMNSEGRSMPRWWVVETDHPGAPVVDVRVRNAPCTILELPTGGRLWLLGEARRVIGRVEPGETIEFPISLRWIQNRSPNDTIRLVTGDGRTVDAELLEVSRVGDEITCIVRVTVRPDHEGLIYTEIRFHGFREGHSAGLTIIGRAERVRMSSAQAESVRP